MPPRSEGQLDIVNYSYKQLISVRDQSVISLPSDYEGGHNTLIFCSHPPLPGVWARSNKLAQSSQAYTSMNKSKLAHQL